MHTACTSALSAMMKKISWLKSQHRPMAGELCGAHQPGNLPEVVSLGQLGLLIDRLVF